MEAGEQWGGDSNALYVRVVFDVRPGLACKVCVGVANVCNYFDEMVGFVLWGDFVKRWL